METGFTCFFCLLWGLSLLLDRCKLLGSWLSVFDAIQSSNRKLACGLPRLLLLNWYSFSHTHIRVQNGAGFFPDALYPLLVPKLCLRVVRFFRTVCIVVVEKMEIAAIVRNTHFFYFCFFFFFGKVEVVAFFFWLYLTRFYRLPFSGGLGHLSGKKQQQNCCSTPYCLPPPFTATTRLSTQQTQASGRSEDDDATSRAGTVFLLSLPF